jgi:hypothetical protein
MTTQSRAKEVNSRFKACFFCKQRKSSFPKFGGIGIELQVQVLNCLDDFVHSLLCEIPSVEDVAPIIIQPFVLMINLFDFQQCNQFSKLLHFILIHIDGRYLRNLADFIVTLLKGP